MNIERFSGTQSNELSKKATNMEKITDQKQLDSPVAKDIRVVPDSPEGYNRPYLRADVKKEIYDNAPTDNAGNYLDANTGLPIVGTPDIGHKAGHEHKREALKAYNSGLTQSEFNDKMSNASYYQLEDLHNNRSHQFEDKSSY